MLLALSGLIFFYRPGVDSWWSIHLTILWGFGTGVVALYLVGRNEAWRLLWGARTLTAIERDIHDHVRSIERRVDRIERVDVVVAGLARLPQHEHHD